MGSDRHRPPNRCETVYCSACGETLSPAANYCTNCGTAIAAVATGSVSGAGDRDGNGNGDGDGDRERDATTTPERRSTPHRHRLYGIEPSNRGGLEHRIATAARNGWQLEHDFGDHAVLVRRTFGSPTDHLLVATVTVWWTMGLGNALYGAYHYFGRAERRVVQAYRADDEEPAKTRTAKDGHSASSLVVDRLTAAVCWLGAAVFAAAGSLAATTTASLVFVLLAVVVGAVGTATLPSVRNRLDRRHPVTAIGRVHSVDERTVSGPDRPCAVCADTIDRGVERTYRQADCLFGIPLSISERENHYCRRCANAEGIAGSERPKPNVPVDDDGQRSSTAIGSESARGTGTERREETRTNGDPSIDPQTNPQRETS